MYVNNLYNLFWVELNELLQDYQIFDYLQIFKIGIFLKNASLHTVFYNAYHKHSLIKVATEKSSFKVALR